MVNNEAIIAELGKHPYTPEDKITFGGASHYCKVFKLGSGKIEIVYKSGNAGAICEAMSTTECIDKNGIIVDGTDVYVLKETSPRGTFARYVVLETNTGMQLKGIVDASSVSLTKGQSIGAINGGANKSTLPITGDYEGQLATCEDGSTYVWDGTAWIRQNNECGNNYIATIDQFFSVYEIGTHDSKQGSRLMQVGFDFKISFNTCCTFNGNVKLIGVYDSSYGLSTRSKFMVWTAPSSLCLGKDYPLDANDVTTPFDISKFATFNIRSKIVNNDVHKVYLEIAVNRSALATSIRNRMNPVFTFSNFDYDKDFVPTLNNTLLETGTSDSEFNTKYGYKKCSTEYFTGVPISTSTNQMLVSTENGGWKATGDKYSICGVQPSQRTHTTASKYAILKLGSRPYSSGYGNGEVSVHYTMSRDNFLSQECVAKIITNANTSGVLGSNSSVMITYLGWNQVSSYAFNQPSCLGSQDIFFVGVVENERLSLYMVAKNNADPSGKAVCDIAVSSIYGDMDWSFTTECVTQAAYSELPWSTYQIIGVTAGVGNRCEMMVVPKPTTADSGKVLKVNNNGEPTWSN